ncbi:MAG: type II toxin-antitoxin system RelE/ParE family toxin [Spirochaetales bacterium]|nr:type II toxin-antitoxin system RelE/ParE family toxin [Spirochaetales bacterium]
MYKIKLTETAADSLRSFDAGTRNKIISRIEELKESPLQLGKSLSGPLKEYRTIRAAGQRYRIIYKVLEREVVVVVINVGIRKEGDKKDIYSLMKKLLNTGLLD